MTFYKKNRYKDWAYWLDWFMFFLVLFLGYDAIFVVGLESWRWGFINFELIMTIIIILMYLTIRNLIDQKRMYKILKEDAA